LYRFKSFSHETDFLHSLITSWVFPRVRISWTKLAITKPYFFLIVFPHTRIYIFYRRYNTLYYWASNSVLFSNLGISHHVHKWNGSLISMSHLVRHITVLQVPVWWEMEFLYTSPVQSQVNHHWKFPKIYEIFFIINSPASNSSQKFLNFPPLSLCGP